MTIRITRDPRPYTPCDYCGTKGTVVRMVLIPRGTELVVSTLICSACAGDTADEMHEAARRPAPAPARSVRDLFERGEPDEDLRPLLRASIARAKGER